MNPSFRAGPPATQEDLHTPPFHSWTVPPDQSLWCAFHREHGGYRLRFPGLADFLVSANGLDVRAIPVPGLDATTLEHLYLNQVLPLALSKQGEPVFHASAVVLPHGAVAFVAESGRGKSTLATHFALAGALLLTDDGLVLDQIEQGFLVRPSHPSVRLWEDSREALVGERLATAPPVSYTSKARLLAGDALPHATAPAPLRRAYFLGTGECDQVRIEPIASAEAALCWVRHSFILDVEERPRLASHFAQVGRLASLGISFRLDYPRDYDRLPEVRRAVLAHLATMSTVA